MVMAADEGETQVCGEFLTDVKDDSDVAEYRLIEIKLKGTLEKGDCGANPCLQPEWLDKERFERAKVLAKRHLFGLFFNHLCGLTLLVHVKAILSPLLSTGKSATVSHLFRRYLGTLSHVKLWYEGDVWDEKDAAHRSLLQVRGMHKRVADKLNDNKTQGKDEMSLSQYDMMITQFAFVGLVILYPAKFGISWTEDELKSVMHFWRGIGYLLGIEDRFNLFNSENSDEVKSLCKAILSHEIKPVLYSTPAQEAQEMSRGIIESIRPYILLMAWKPFYKYLLEVIEVRQEAVLGMRASLSYHCMRITLNHLLHIYVLALLLNGLLRLALRSAQRKRNKISKHLSDKYTLLLGDSVGQPIRSSLYDNVA